MVKEYLDAFEDYKKKAAQTGSWREFCSAQDRESLLDGIYRVLRKTKRRREEVLLVDTSGRTLNPQESAELLANTLFPSDSTDAESEYQRAKRAETEGISPAALRRLSADDPPFTREEVMQVIKEFSHRGLLVRTG